jgi:ABC-type Zn uptake system ZnuABC Zn-binding protein ZnuA
MRATRGAWTALLIVATALTGLGCGTSAPEQGRRLNVVTTVAPITSIVATVAGDEAEVTGLVPEGTNSHTYEPPPSAARALAEADLVFVNGLGLEEPIRRLAPRRSRVVELGDRAIRPDEHIYDFSFPRSGGKPNPHLWTDPLLAKEYARIAADTLAQHDSRHADEYRANYERFATKADELDRAVRAATASVPEPKLLTYHDAYAYFARRYGWKVIGAIQVASFDEPSPREVADLIAQLRRERVPAIFGSEVFPSPVLAQIGKEAGVRYVDSLRDDDLPGRPGDPHHSWLGLMRLNLVTMVRALGGDPSPLEAVSLDGAATDAARAVYPT